MAPITRRLAAVLPGLLSLAAQAAVPEDFVAVYELSLNRFVIGEAQVALTAQPDGRYEYHSHTRPTGLVKLFRSDRVQESSLFTLYEGRIRPLEYRFDHTGGKKGRHAYLKFDWQERAVSNTVEGHTWEMEIPEGALDKLVVQVAAMMDLTAGRRQTTYFIADGGKLKEYQFVVVGEETIRVPAGEFQTFKIQRVRKNFKRTTHLWCAPSLGYLPVRIEQIEHEDGVTYLSELKQTTLGGE